MYALLVSHALSIEHEKSVSLPLSQWLKIAKNVTFQDAAKRAAYTFLSFITVVDNRQKYISPAEILLSLI